MLLYSLLATMSLCLLCLQGSTKEAKITAIIIYSLLQGSLNLAPFLLVLSELKNFTLASLKVENSDFLVQDYKKSNDSLKVNYCLQKVKMVICFYTCPKITGNQSRFYYSYSSASKATLLFVL